MQGAIHSVSYPHVAASGSRATPLQYLVAAGACGATAAIAALLTAQLDLANIVMLFLLTVVLVAARLGRGPAVASAFLSVALFDFFFVPPKLSFDVSDTHYLLTFAVMLSVALITGALTATLRRQADAACIEEVRTRALYEMARELTGALELSQAAAIVQRFVRESLGAAAVIYVENPSGTLTSAQEVTTAGSKSLNSEMLALAHHTGEFVDLDATPAVAYFPLQASGRVRGVMAVSFDSDESRPEMRPMHEHRERLEAVASLSAIVIERLHYVEVAQHTQLQMQSERLRSSILSALSHDVRTPLTVLTGLADSLSVAQPALPRAQHETACAIRDQALRLSGLVAKLLDMAKLNAGEVKLRREWQPLEEVIGSSIKLLEGALTGHALRVEVPADLPLVEIDSVLIERVLCNLLENAAKFSPAGSAIEIGARDAGANVEVSVRDEGPGIPAGRSDLFGMFVRGEKESARRGFGLGLAICRAIVEAHGGTIAADNEPRGGARFMFTLPKGDAPAIEPEDLREAPA